jgi:hypothetical protein
VAKLSAHGSEVGRVEFNTSAKVYMSDGTVLKNGGFGWKLSGKVKPGVTPLEAFEAQRQAQIKFLAARPALAVYRKALHEMAGLCKRWKLHLAVSTMPEDPDGVWSEACDGYGDNVSASIDEVSHLCALYRCAYSEMEAMKAEAQPVEA